MTEGKKNLLDRAIDALTDRDEKAAAKVAVDKAVTEKAVALKAAADRATTVRLAANKAAGHKAATEKSTAVKAMRDMTEKTDATRATVQKAATERIEATRAAAAPKKGVVTIKSLRIRADHNTTSKVVAGLVDGNEVSILSTWSDGKNTWAKVDKGWAAMVYDGETYIKLA